MKNLLLTFLFFQAVLTVSAAEPNWEYVRPYPHANTYWDAETDDSGNVYMVGDGGTVTVFDGETMTDLGAPTDKVLFGISVIASNDIWVAGGNRYADDPGKVPVILHYNGSTWTEHEGPTFFDSSYVCNDIYAAADDDIWVAGSGGTWLWHYDGAQWDWYMNMPPGVEGTFNQFFGFAQNDIYLVGTHGQILHYDGSTWQLEQKKESGSFSTNLLADVWGPDPDHVFATGNNAQIYSRVVSVTGYASWDELHWDGNWFGGDSLGTIWGPSATEIYVAGNGLFRFINGDLVDLGENERGFIMNKMVDGPGGEGAVLVGTNGSVWWFKDGSLNAINLSGRGVAQGSDGFPYGDNTVMFGTNQIYASTTNYLWLTDGNQVTPFPSLPVSVDRLRAMDLVTGRPGKDIWVGLMRNQVDNDRETVHYWDGSAWHEANIYTSPSAIWPLGNGNMYYFDKYSGMMHYNEGSSTTIDATVLGVNDIFARADDDIYIVGSAGSVWHFDGQTVQKQISGVTENLTDIDGDEDEVYAVGANRTAIYKKSGAWKKVASLESREENAFRTIIGVGDDTFLAMLTTPSGYIGGNRGEIYTFKNGNLLSVRRGMTNSLEGVGKTKSGRAIGWGTNGLLMEVTDSSVAEHRQVVDTKDSLTQVLGDTKATLTFSDDSSGVQMLSARSYSGPPEGLAAQQVLAASQHWVVASSIENVTATVSFQYDPNAIPAGRDISRASLYRNNGTDWLKVPTTVSPQANTIAVSDATQLSAWTFGWDNAEPEYKPEDINRDGRIDGQDVLLLNGSWHDSGAGQEDIDSNGVVDGRDLMRLQALWYQSGIK